MKLWQGKTAFEKFCIALLAVSFACTFLLAAYMVAGSIQCGAESDCMRALTESTPRIRTLLAYGSVGSWALCLGMVLVKGTYKMIEGAFH